MRPVKLSYTLQALSFPYQLRLMHGIQQYELEPEAQCGVPVVEVHYQEAESSLEVTHAIALASYEVPNIVPALSDIVRITSENSDTCGFKFGRGQVLYGSHVLY